LQSDQSLRLHQVACERMMHDFGHAYGVRSVPLRYFNAARAEETAVTGCKIDARDAHRRSGDPAILVADATVAQDLLGWSAKRSDLATVISDAWQWPLRRFGRRELIGVAGVAAFSK
jgi:UDP-glucose 4-epimerase